ncbi:hypothetical protein PABG_11223 [Paracoccidioides brasiliensis Pb03]|nr:hypothetical protein PABG_11223 [Paracoccidioides brasiliensis Pb03]
MDGLREVLRGKNRSRCGGALTKREARRCQQQKLENNISAARQGESRITKLPRCKGGKYGRISPLEVVVMMKMEETHEPGDDAGKMQVDAARPNRD